MTKIVDDFGRKTPTDRWTIALAAGALAAVVAAATPAAAWDPQATAAEIDNSLNYHAAASYDGAPMYRSGAYAAAPRRHRADSSASTRGAGPYASAHTSEQSTTPPPPHKAFQDYK